MKVKYLEIDDDVNVFVVGDLHASYSLLKEELKLQYYPKRRL